MAESDGPKNGAESQKDSMSSARTISLPAAHVQQTLNMLGNDMGLVLVHVGSCYWHCHQTHTRSG